ncbi:hypothetical protein CLV30_12047 [Haloactinopolyspora alba]|uniref:Uncharacterized protein n=1 Tax=Haloactinopolyspora alba TaxID=648780 RepID=A0A2P8DM29_9ACTN|nr:hypothetical protein CLV30_12047 [Haloactinopolyspora alba]
MIIARIVTTNHPHPPLARRTVDGNVPPVTVERRKPREVPVDPDITDELRAADAEARDEVAERSSELLERLRQL